MFIARRCSAVGLLWYDLRRLRERVGDVELGLAEDDARLLLARRLRLARHRVLERAGNDDVAHLDRRDGDAPRVRAPIDQLLQLVLDALAAAQQIGQRGPADDVAQRRLRRPADRLLVVLHLERRLLGVVHHPEQHRVDVDRHGVRGQRLLGREAGGDGALVDPRRHAIDERDRPRTGRGRAGRRSGRSAAPPPAPTAARAAAHSAAPGPRPRPARAAPSARSGSNRPSPAATAASRIAADTTLKRGNATSRRSRRRSD